MFGPALQVLYLVRKQLIQNSDQTTCWRFGVLGLCPHQGQRSGPLYNVYTKSTSYRTGIGNCFPPVDGGTGGGGGKGQLRVYAGQSCLSAFCITLHDFRLDENCILLNHYAAIGRPETSAKNFHYSLRNNSEERHSLLYYIVFILPYFYIFLLHILSVLPCFYITLFLGCLFSMLTSFCYHLSVSPCCCVEFLYFTLFLYYFSLYFIFSIIPCFSITLFLYNFFYIAFFLDGLFLYVFSVLLSFYVILYIYIYLLVFTLFFLLPYFYITLFLPFPFDSTRIVPCFQFDLQSRKMGELSYKGGLLDSEF